MQERYKRNLGIVSEQQQYKLLNQSIAIIGLGGQGGYIADAIARLGVKKMVIFDPDKFEESNLNRQLFCNIDTLGNWKAEQTAKALKAINPDLTIEYYCEAFGLNHIAIVSDCDFVFACCDSGYNAKENREAFKLLMKKNIPVMDVAVTGFGCQLHCNLDNFDAWDELSEQYCKTTPEDAHQIGQPAFLCALASNLAVAEMVKYFVTPFPKTIMHALIVYDIYKNEIFRFPMTRQE